MTLKNRLNANLTLILLLVLFFTACNKKRAVEFDAEFTGLWTAHASGQIYFLDINGGDNQSFYEIQGQETIYGTAIVNTKKDELKISSITLSIDQYPNSKNVGGETKWYMIVNSLLYTRS